jgi:hypothetical protein
MKRSTAKLDQKSKEKLKLDPKTIRTLVEKELKEVTAGDGIPGLSKIGIVCNG